ncbi:MAG: hypothetical protein Ct9H300mP14_09270 [Gammaproteobacteria bacterium]|nr:MAG: hypothetical protein Ct9H300mP14_09270 [Gammaproteobacteria bacterium]
MVGKARQWMQAHGFDFIVTGEVVGQRPMSQRRETFPVVQRESGAGDLLLRPLCAKLQSPTAAERNGWVDRQSLYDFSGRGPKTTDGIGGGPGDRGLRAAGRWLLFFDRRDLLAKAQRSMAIQG